MHDAAAEYVTQTNKQIHHKHKPLCTNTSNNKWLAHDGKECIHKLFSVPFTNFMCVNVLFSGGIPQNLRSPLCFLWTSHALYHLKLTIQLVCLLSCYFSIVKFYFCNQQNISNLILVYAQTLAFIFCQKIHKTISSSSVTKLTWQFLVQYWLLHILYQVQKFMFTNDH